MAGNLEGRPHIRNIGGGEIKNIPVVSTPTVGEEKEPVAQSNFHPRISIEIDPEAPTEEQPTVVIVGFRHQLQERVNEVHAQQTRTIPIIETTKPTTAFSSSTEADYRHELRMKELQEKVKKEYEEKAKSEAKKLQDLTLQNTPEYRAKKIRNILDTESKTLARLEKEARDSIWTSITTYFTRGKIREHINALREQLERLEPQYKKSALNSEYTQPTKTEENSKEGYQKRITLVKEDATKPQENWMQKRRRESTQYLVNPRRPNTMNHDIVNTFLRLDETDQNSYVAQGLDKIQKNNLAKTLQKIIELRRRIPNMTPSALDRFAGRDPKIKARHELAELENFAATLLLHVPAIQFEYMSTDYTNSKAA